MRSALPTLTAVAVALVAGCSSSHESQEPLTDSDIQDRVAGAMREAGTYTFEWSDPPTGGREETVTTGSVEYDDDGDVETLELATADGQQFRLVDGTMYRRADGADFQQVPESERSDVLTSWDWASAAESVPGLEDVTERGDDEIAGEPATEYELTYRDGTMTWWVGDDDRLLKWVDGESGGTITDYGEPVDVTPPDQSP